MYKKYKAAAGVTVNARGATVRLSVPRRHSAVVLRKHINNATSIQRKPANADILAADFFIHALHLILLNVHATARARVHKHAPPP